MEQHMVTQLQVLRTAPGRMRVHVSNADIDLLTASLQRLPGVRDIQANPLTGNILLRFDPTVTDAQTLLALGQGRAENPCHATMWPLCAQQGNRRPASATPGALPVTASSDTASRPRVGGTGARYCVALVPRVTALLAQQLLADSPLGLLAWCYEAARLALRLIGPRLLGGDNALTVTRSTGGTWSLHVRVVVRG